ncbi:hypothetical protein BH10ACT7_BH10ACT7_21000 [soil metagenome]
MFTAPVISSNPNLIDWNDDYIPRVPGTVSTVYTGVQNTSAFNLHSYLTYFDGQFIAIWSSGYVGEDNEGQVIRYATSADAATWSSASVIAGPTTGLRYIARGLWIRDGELYALMTSDEPGDYFGESLELFAYQWDSVNDTWVSAGLVFDDAINNFAPQATDDGEWIMTRRDSDMTSSILKGGVTGIDDWTPIALPEGPAGSRLDEPDLIVRDDHAISAHIRDNAQSFRLVRTISTDDGETWSPAEVTNFPDSRAKNNNLRLSTGEFALINNPRTSTSRLTLSIALSDDGLSYDRIGVIREGATAPRWPGNAKSSGYMYPQGYEHDGVLYVIYSLNKEDIQVVAMDLDDVTGLAGPDAAEALLDFADTIQNELDGSTAGTQVGDYPASALAVVQAAIDDAVSEAGRVGATDAELDAAARALTQAWEALPESRLDACSGTGGIVVDNSDPGFSTDGSTWPVSSNPRLIDQAVGDSYATSGSQASQPSRWASWSTSIPTTGEYIVCMNWTSDDSRVAAAPVEVEHRYGTYATTVDQRTGGGTWQGLGTFEFRSGETATITISAAGSGYTAADAIKLVPVGSSALSPVPGSCTALGSLVVDNGGTGFATSSAAWTTSTNPSYVAQAVGGSYMSDNSPSAQPGEWASWTPTLPAAGEYAVCANWVSHSSRPDAAPMTITFSGDTDSFTVNQQTAGGAWHNLGTFPFAAGTAGSVLIDASDAGYTIADAVGFVPVAE